MFVLASSQLYFWISSLPSCMNWKENYKNAKPKSMRYMYSPF